jgi:hypothetical protein
LPLHFNEQKGAIRDGIDLQGCRGKQQLQGVHRQPQKRFSTLFFELRVSRDRSSYLQKVDPMEYVRSSHLKSFAIQGAHLLDGRLHLVTKICRHVDKIMKRQTSSNGRVTEARTAKEVKRLTGAD